MKVSREKEDYIKAIYKLNGIEDYVSNKEIADFLAISPPSVSDMLKKMEKESLVELIAYKGVKLSDKGLRMGIDVVRKHRLIEVFLYEKLGYDLSELDEDAEQMEHITSTLFYDRLEALLDHPTHCPHGSIIPSYYAYNEPENIDLLHAQAKQVLRLSRILDNLDLIQYLDKIGLKLHDELVIKHRDDVNQLVVIRHKGQEHYLGYTLAKMLFVNQIQGDDEHDGN